MSSEPTAKEQALSELAQTFGQDAIETVRPSENLDIPKDSGNAAPPAGTVLPSCITQRARALPVAVKNAPHHIVVGLDGTVPRWAPGSVINWTTWGINFKTPEHAQYATDQLKIACDQWNSYDVGVTFKWVPAANDATFALAYGGDGPSAGVLASAFFPTYRDLNFMLVYARSFADLYWYENMSKIFAHELGHVLGLRHEFALEEQFNPQTGTWQAVEGDAVRIGPEDERSVMNYSSEHPPEIQENDVKYTKEFYSLRGTPGVNSGRPKIGRLNVYDYQPM